VGYGIAAVGFGFEGWTTWHHVGLAGGCAAMGLAVSVGILNAAHRQAVRRFGEGKLGPHPCGQRPPTPPPLPPHDPESPPRIPAGE
jgi:hypothetical protein